MARKHYIAGQFTSLLTFFESVAGLAHFCLWWLISFVQANGYGQSAVVCGQRLPTLFVCVPLKDSANYPTVRLALPRSPLPPHFLHRVKARGWALCRCQEVLRNLTSGDGWENNMKKPTIVIWLHMGVQHAQPSQLSCIFQSMILEVGSRMKPTTNPKFATALHKPRGSINGGTPKWMVCKGKSH